MNNYEQRFNHLLVIDDNEAIHDDFKKIFEPAVDNNCLNQLEADLFGDSSESTPKRVQFDLTCASQGQAGLAQLKRAQENQITFGAAFVDMRMPPGWDGVETIENLWKVDPDLQVVICTAFSDKSWEEIVNRLGHTDQLLVLKKPFDEIEVVQIACSLSTKRRLLAETKTKVESLEDVVESQVSELHDAHQDAEVLIDSISSVLVSVDEDGNVCRWNPKAAEIFELDSVDVIGKRFEDLPIAWENWNVLQDAILKRSEERQQKLDIQFVDRRGQLKTLYTTVCPILNSRACLILASDVTLQNALQNQLDQALRMESVGQLAAGVAHEINTPMQYIGDNVRFVAKSISKLAPYLECLPKLADSEVTNEQMNELRASISSALKPSKIKSSLKQIPEALADSIEGVEAVSKIVAAMKEFSHPGSEQKSQVCVNHTLNSTVTVAKNEWKYVAEVETDFEKDLIKIDALPGELNQAFLNIIVNASHAIGDRVEAGDFEKGFIKLSTRTVGETVHVEIQDNGGGIPASARDRVFEPFYTTKEVGKGTGQGLAIAYTVIVQKHGGKIIFDVEEGVGTTFRIELPQFAVEPSEETQSSEPTQSRNGMLI